MSKALEVDVSKYQSCFNDGQKSLLPVVLVEALLFPTTSRYLAVYVGTPATLMLSRHDGSRT